MEQTKFISDLASLFEEEDVNLFTAQTKFKNLAEWSSLTALSVIAMVDDEYGVKIKGEDIRSAETVEDLYNIVKLKK